MVDSISQPKIGQETGYTWIQSQPNTPLAINPDGGNVGIGTTRPLTRLHASIEGAAQPTILTIDSVVSNAYTDVTQGIHFFKTHTSGRWGWKIEGSGPSDAEAMLKIISSQAGNDTARLTIARTTGNVGIGTTAPAQKLMVVGPHNAGKDPDSGMSYGGQLAIKGNAPQLDFIDTDHNDWSIHVNDNRMYFIRQPWNHTDLVLDGAGNVGIGTLDTKSNRLYVSGNVRADSIFSKPQLFTFKVEGDGNKFYPVVFSDDGWADGPMTLELTRPNVHLDAQWRGALNAKFTCHSSAWGHGADFCRAEIYCSEQQFVAGYQNVYKSGKFVVWLRGQTTYQWRANHFVTLTDFAATAKTVDGESLAIKETIDRYVLASGLHFDRGLVVDGNVGIGTTDPGNVKFKVEGNAHITGTLWANTLVHYWEPGGLGWVRLENRAGNVTGNASTSAPSDIRFKTALRPIHNALEKVLQLHGKCYRWGETGLKYFTQHITETFSAGPDATEDDNQKLWDAERQKAYQALSGDKIGLIAQELETVMPEVVHEDEEGYKYIHYHQLTALLVEAIKEQNALIQSLSGKVAALEGR